MDNKDTLQAQDHDLCISLLLNTNSAVSNISNATIVYWALRDYKLDKLKYIIKYHAESVGGASGLEDAADMWNEILSIEALQVEITDKAIELAEKNYWKAEQLRNPSDYAKTKLGHTESKARMLADYLEEFKIAIP
ncbi:hypothetical protein GO755_14200 [Spirosoma sp. HMF4905]|uniref:Uncharacterized protein n=1 Tax=Spirosoma arboris TaxID=2682092 RepID=A0A7K1SBM8_9BACT|nr:hypothetical protein [Spirosoma arboris]MVM31190.1 hypothetical protein [Spirosoma arboris]